MTGTITSISPSKRDPNMRDVYVDDSLETTLPATVVVQLKIEIDKEWTPEIGEHAETIAATETARHMALSLISRRMWGSNELATRLVKRGVDQTIARIVTEQLVEDDWMNDLKYASALIRQWVRKEPAGRRWLRHKLREKQLSVETAIEAIDAELGDTSEQESANAFASIRLSKLHGVHEDTATRRVRAALNRRGFDASVAMDAIRLSQDDDA
jgi:SOS response regulatory protein OraA/RecX